MIFFCKKIIVHAQLFETAEYYYTILKSIQHKLLCLDNEYVYGVLIPKSCYSTQYSHYLLIMWGGGEKVLSAMGDRVLSRYSIAKYRDTRSIVHVQ